MHNYQLLEKKYVNDIDSTVHIFEHQTGAKIMAVKNDDDNKVFYIGFRTPVSDSTGLPHILEHCILNGSRKYKTKEPFMDLVKGSLNTFLNAMTYPDKTIYPVASRNDKDFENLMDVYLDAVFFPIVYQKEEIFKQEGWHYEINDKEEPLRYKGVVYNEMRGAYSDPEQVVFQECSKGLFPDTNYAYSSGGDPYQIPSLKYDDFLNFHQKYYHPSNAYIYVYGNGDLSKELSHIDEYLSEFKKEEIDSQVLSQKPFKEMRRISKEYSLASNQDPKNKDYLLYGVQVGESKSLQEKITRDVISHVLFSSDASSLKSALLDLEICDDISNFDFGEKQMALALLAKNSSKEHIDLFYETIQKELTKIVEKGIEKDELRAVLNRIEFDYREAGGFPTPGLIYGINVLESWIYDGDPFEYLEFESVLNRMKDLVETDYYEEAIQELILDNPHKILMDFVAVPGLNAAKDREVAQWLDDYKKSLSDRELESLIKSNQALTDFQNREDTVEEKKTIPQLSLDDVSGKIEAIPREIIEKGPVQYLYHDLSTKKILYLNLAFDINHIETDHLPALSLFSVLLGQMDTDQYDYKQLSTQINLHTGGLSISPNIYASDKNKDRFNRKLTFSVKLLSDKYKKGIDLIKDILTTNFNNEKRLLEILRAHKLSLEENIINSGHMYGATEAASNFSALQHFNSQTSGYKYYRWIENLLANFDDLKGDLFNLFDYFKKTIFTKNVIFNITTDYTEFEMIEKELDSLVELLSDELMEAKPYSFDKKEEQLAISTSANINFVSLVVDLSNTDFNYRGSDVVLAHFLSQDYLYQQIRAQGGAYGQGMSITKDGRIEFTSYRDPNLARSLEVYRNTANYLDNLEITQDEINNAIIGSYNRFDPPLTAAMKGKKDLILYLSDSTHSKLEERLEEALETTVDDFKGRVNYIKNAAQAKYLCVIGNQESIEENKDIFSKIEKL